MGERGTDTRDPDEKLSDAQRALACLESLLMKHPDDDLTLIHPANLAGFLRLVLAQFPE